MSTKDSAAALYYAANGFPVLPCDPAQNEHSKAPLIDEGFYGATTDPAVVEQWWTDWPDALIGFPTGRRTGVLVIDVDSGPPAHAHDGLGEWIKLEAEYDTARTRLHGTASGGNHRVYAFPHLRPIGLKRGNLPPGMEVRGNGGYVIFPPSKLLDGREWSVLIDERPAGVPKWLLDVLQPDKRGEGGGGRRAGGGRKKKWTKAGLAAAERELVVACDALVRCPPGERDQLISQTKTVLHVGSLAAGGGLDREQALAALIDAGARGGLGSKNIEKIRLAFATGLESPAEPPTFERGETVGDYIVDADGRPLANVANVLALFREKGFAAALRHNEMIGAAMLTGLVEGLTLDGPFPRRVGDTDITSLMEYVQHASILETRFATIRAAVDTFALENPFHPFRDWLDGLEWDGKKRLGRLFPSYLGTAATRYTILIGAYFLTSTVARAYRPGCKVDYMVILEGGQGIYKSMACRALVGEEYFAENLPNILKKDALEQLPGKVLIELGEIVNLLHEDMEGFKAFLTRQTDRFRISYGHYTEDYQRVPVFIGTTNRSEYLDDPTGARRFWPVTVGQIELDALKRDRDQLFAEAVVRYKRGRRWWPSRRMERRYFVSEQDARQEVDDREATIATWIVKEAPGASGSIRARWAAEAPRGFTLTEIWRDALKMRDDVPFGTALQRQIAKCLKRLDCEQPKARMEKRRFWLPPKKADWLDAEVEKEAEQSEIPF